MKFLLSLILLLILWNCTPKNTNYNSGNDLLQLQKLMTGTFTSEAQSVRDSNYYNITLTMVPIWENRKIEGSRFLYVEQAVTANKKNPYRQRVYELIDKGNERFESKVFELPSPEEFIHGWENPEVFTAIGTSDLLLREGCTVFLEKNDNQCFSGSTMEQTCRSSLRGATFASSVVTICENSIESWDQGWNDNQEQVWGATQGGYIFDRLSE